MHLVLPPPERTDGAFESYSIVHASNAWIPEPITLCSSQRPLVKGLELNAADNGTECLDIDTYAAHKDHWVKGRDCGV